MKYLLDTHVFLWWISDHAGLSIAARTIIQNPSNIIYLSAASCWEIAIKIGIGRLELPDDPAKFIPEQLAVNHFSGLPIHLSHAFEVQSLPKLHKDPFDRMLVAQARIEALTVLTGDPMITRYDVPSIW